MLTRRKILFAGLAGAVLAGCDHSGSQSVTQTPSFTYLVNSNLYTASVTPGPGVNKRLVETGETWETLFGERASFAQHLNRQNTDLVPGQSVLIPHPSLTMSDISPFTATRQTGPGYQAVFDHAVYAFGLYLEGQLVRWGAAVGGKHNKTTLGRFSVSETAGSDRVSSIYPTATNGGAPMPFFMRIHGAIGAHAGECNGIHESQGCVRMFYEDAKWLNLDIARPSGLQFTVV